MRILGLDEAGRGSVLGPLVVGGFLVEGEDDDDAQAGLRAAGADDSKQLSARRRSQAQERLATLGQARTVHVTPAEIDAGNVNALEEAAFLALVAELRPDRVYLDAPVHPRGIPALRRRLQDASGVEDWIVAPKADATWAVVGAASIAAKLARDAAIAALGPDVGSGYPSDPLTRAWLTARLTDGEPLPACVRTRWDTLESLRQGTLFPASSPGGGGGQPPPQRLPRRR
jgi:ribonuclease HII